jgi:Tfp pilus assembly protein PilX
MHSSPPSAEIPIPEADASRRAGERRGMALITALFSIVVLAIIVSGVFFSSQQEFRGARNALVEQRSFTVSEFGLNSEISNWDRMRNVPGNFPVGSIDANQVYVAEGDTAWVTVTRLSDNGFWVVSDGKASMGTPKMESRRQTSAYVRIAYPTISPKGAITAAGNVKLQGSTEVNGDNNDPTGWTQCASIPGSTVPAVAVPPASTVTYNSQNITSTPEVQYDPAAADSNTYVRYGSESWNSLTANADITLPGGNYGADIEPIAIPASISPPIPASCDRSKPLNWGEPFRPGTAIECYDYFPIIYVDGDIHINGNGRGQGILLVNGDLEVNGNFEFFGIVIVRNDITKGNGTAKIHGAVFAADLDLGSTSGWFTGDQDVFYSKCAIESALRGSAILVRAKERAWVQVF